MFWVFVGACGVAAANGAYGIWLKSKERSSKTKLDRYIGPIFKAIAYGSYAYAVYLVSTYFIGWWFW